MIEGKITINSQPIEELAGFVTGFNTVIAEIGQDIANEIEPHVLNELQYYPAPWTGGKRRWTSERQRKFVMAKLRRENNLPYQRTGGLGKSWSVATETVEGTFKVIVQTSADIAKYVVGSLDFRSRNNAMRPMQRMHQDTGWFPAIDTVRYWFDTALELFEEKLDARLGDLVAKTTAQRRSRKS